MDGRFLLQEFMIEKCFANVKFLENEAEGITARAHLLHIAEIRNSVWQCSLYLFDFHNLVLTTLLSRSCTFKCNSLIFTAVLESRMSVAALK